MFKNLHLAQENDPTGEHTSQPLSGNISVSIYSLGKDLENMV